MDKTYIVAEIGNTHEGSVGLAKMFAAAAADCGVDAVKFQTHIFHEESLESAPNPPYFKGESRKNYFERTSFTRNQWVELKEFCEKKLKIDFFSTPFSIAAIELLESIGVHTFKIPSGDVNNTPFLERIARTKKKVVLSTGMSSWDDIDSAVEILQSNNCGELIILQCTSAYPCPPELSGLNIIEELSSRYKNIKIGYSDHTNGHTIPLAAVIKGACFIEKHFTLSKKMYGSDALNATEPEEFKELVMAIRVLEDAILNPVDKDQVAESLHNMKDTFEKSIVLSRPLNKGHKLRFDDLAFKKPGDGIKANLYKKVIGCKITESANKDFKLSWKDLT
jgi:N,N'-diacetyllegionaminate synthase